MLQCPKKYPDCLLLICFLLQKCVLQVHVLYTVYIENITRWRGDMNFMCEWSRYCSCHGVFDDFPQIFDHLPRISKDFSNCPEDQTNVPEHFPRISENFRRFPKIAEHFRGRPEDVSMIHQRI